MELVAVVVAVIGSIGAGGVLAAVTAVLIIRWEPILSPLYAPVVATRGHVPARAVAVSEEEDE